MSRLVRSCVLLAGFAALSGLVFAHHGSSAYDTNKPLSFSGTVTQLVWSNPHCQILFDTKDEIGNIVHWAGETSSPGVLARAGWTKITLQPGDKIKITLFPSKTTSHLGIVSTLSLASGKVLLKDERNQPAPQSRQ